MVRVAAVRVDLRLGEPSARVRRAKTEVGWIVVRELSRRSSALSTQRIKRSGGNRLFVALAGRAGFHGCSLPSFGLGVFAVRNCGLGETTEGPTDAEPPQLSMLSFGDEPW